MCSTPSGQETFICAETLIAASGLPVNADASRSVAGETIRQAARSDPGMGV